MIGWLCYEQPNAKQNAWFIERLIALCKERGITLILKTDLKGENPDFAIVRAIRPDWNRELEKRGVKVFNNAQTSAFCNDKYESYKSAKAWNIPVMETQFLGAPKGYPCVMKSVDGHGGQEVFWLDNERDFLLAKEKLFKRKYILQKPCKTLGRDMRIYALGGKVVGCVLRSSDTSFKSNFSLGGKVKKTTATARQKEIVKTLYEKLNFDFVGIDFIKDGNRWVFNEMEDPVGARMLYAVSKTDIAKKLIDYIVERL